MSYLHRMIEESLNTGNTIFSPNTYIQLLNSEILPLQVEELPHRKDQTKQVFSAYQSLLSGWPEIHLVLSGDSGTGKSASIQLVEKHFKKKNLIETEVFTDNRDLPNSRVVHVNCEEYSTYTQILQYIVRAYFSNEIHQKVIKKLNIKSHVIPERGLSQFDYFLIFKQCFIENKGSTLFVFDKFNKIRKTDDANKLILALKNVITELKISFPDSELKLSIIVVITDLSQLNSILDDDALNYMYKQEITFEKYNAVQLMDIIETRLPAFQQGVMPLEVLKYIADHVGEMNGCARYAINLLRDSGRIAQANKQAVVSIENVNQSISKYSTNQVSKLLEEFSFHRMLTLVSFFNKLKHESDSVSTDEIFKGFEELLTQTGSHTTRDYRTITRYLHNFVERGFLVRSARKGEYMKGVHVNYQLSSRYSITVLKRAILENKQIQQYKLVA